VWAKRIIFSLSFAAALLLASCQQAIAPNGQPRIWNVASQDAQALDRVVASILDQQYDPAMVELLSLEMRFESIGDFRHAAEATFWLGYCNEKLGRTTDAARAYEHVIEKYPRQPAAAQASQRRVQLTSPPTPAQ
jgi:tetratricopeptide (TPR) repeat protein